MGTYKELLIWKKSYELALKLYKLTESFPEREKYGLTQQLRRCAVSVPSNIAEGASRGTDRYFVQFLRVSPGSLNELETQVMLSSDLTYMPQSQEILNDISEISRMIYALINYRKSLT